MDQVHIAIGAMSKAGTILSFALRAEQMEPLDNNEFLDAAARAKTYLGDYAIYGSAVA